MSGRILRADELLPTPWRNGLGVTREIALCPPGADTDDFLWRASVADVVGPAPFSQFPGHRPHASCCWPAMAST